MGWAAGIRAYERPGRCAKKLIRQAAHAADGYDTPPAELTIYWMCRRFPGALPQAGAIYDQDAGLMNRMAAADRVYSFVRHLRSLKGKQIHSLSDSDRRLWKSLITEGIL
jgi:hypothetical protein